PGTYFVQEVVPDGYVRTVPTSPDYYTIHATAGLTSATNNFANFEKFSISGTKFEDANGDGATTNDSGAGGWTIVLDNDTNATNGNLQTTTTAADGTYSFNNLGPGTYYVYEELQSGWVQTL